MRNFKLIFSLYILLVSIITLNITALIFLPNRVLDYLTAGVIHYIDFSSFLLINFIISYLKSNKKGTQIITINKYIILLFCFFLYLFPTGSLIIFGSPYDLVGIFFVTIVTVILQMVIFYINNSFQKIFHLILFTLSIIGINAVLYRLQAQVKYYLLLSHTILLLNSIYSFVLFCKKYSVKSVQK